jgi:hypothetical protein
MDAATLRENLFYDRTTGDFIRLIGSSRAPVGEVAGYVDPSHGYVRISVCGKEYYAHRLAWLWVTGSWPESRVDHRNLVRSDNRWDNLRAATHAENCQNTGARAHGTSGRKGVTWHKVAGKWMAQIMAGRKKEYLGLYATREEAGAAYDAAAKRLHGEFSGGV